MRRAGRVPGNLYGHDVDPVAVQASERELEALVGSISVENTLVDLELDDGSARKVLIREIQRHPVRPKILHVDFFEIRADEKLRVNVPLRLVGTPVGVKNGGVLQQIRYELEVDCLPADIPESFEVDISALGIGDSLHVRDVPSAGFVFSEEADLTICAVSAPRIVEEEPTEEVPGLLEEAEAEPEVITARRGEDEDEDEGED
jgi:large subunit ribosomal protein L25